MTTFNLYSQHTELVIHHFWIMASGIATAMDTEGSSKRGRPFAVPTAPEAALPPGYRRDWKGRVVKIDEAAEIAKLRKASSIGAAEGIGLNTTEASEAKTFEMVDMDGEMTDVSALEATSLRASRHGATKGVRSTKDRHRASRRHHDPDVSASKANHHHKLRHHRRRSADASTQGTASSPKAEPVDAPPPSLPDPGTAVFAPPCAGPAQAPSMPTQKRSRWGSVPSLPPPLPVATASSVAPAVAGTLQATASAPTPSSSGQTGAAGSTEEQPEKAKANFGLSGVLRQDAATGNTYKGREMKFVEPPDAALPSVRWRLHEFRGGVQAEKPLHIHRQTAFLFGKDPVIADVLTAHPTCSRQHAVLQYRLVEVEDAHARGGVRRVVKPYIMDLASTNGTSLNGERIDDRRYIELKAMDTLRFGQSSREYVLLHDAVT